MAAIARLQKQSVHLTNTTTALRDFRGLWTGQIPQWTPYATSIDTSPGKWEIRVYAQDASTDIQIVQRQGTTVLKTYSGKGQVGGVLDVTGSNMNFYVAPVGSSAVLDMLVTPL